MLAGVVHDHHNAANTRDQIHRATHAFDQLAGDHPVGKVAVLGHFHRAQNGHGNLAAADHPERGRAVKVRSAIQLGDGLLAGVDQICVLFAVDRKRTHAKHAVFRLQRHVHAFGDVVGHQRRNPDAEVHIPTVLQFLRGTCRHLIAIPSHYAVLTVRCSMRFS